MLGNGQQRAKLLRLAVDLHRQYTNEARILEFLITVGRVGGKGGGRYRGMGGVAGKCPAGSEAATTGSGSGQAIY